MDICIWVFASSHKLYFKDYPGGFWVSLYGRCTGSEPWMTVSCWWCPLKHSWTVFWPLKNCQMIEQFEQLVVPFSTLTVSRYTSRKNDTLFPKGSRKLATQLSAVRVGGVMGSKFVVLETWLRVHVQEYKSESKLKPFLNYNRIKEEGFAEFNSASFFSLDLSAWLPDKLFRPLAVGNVSFWDQIAVFGPNYFWTLSGDNI